MVQLDPTYSSPKEGTLGPYNLKYRTNSSPRHRPKCFHSNSAFPRPYNMHPDISAFLTAFPTIAPNFPSSPRLPRSRKSQQQTKDFESKISLSFHLAVLSIFVLVLVIYL